MSKYRDQFDDSNIICPYCKCEYQPEGEDFHENELDEECSECGMKFYSYQSITITNHSEPDCELNGQTHQWEPIKLRSGETHYFCSICDKCRLTA